MQREVVGFVGVGRMGGRMARRLVDAGHEVRVFDRDEAAVAALVAAGAVRAASAADAAAGARVVLCSLPGPAVVADAVLGADGVLAGAAAGTLVVDTTTSDAQTSQRVAERCAERGVRYLDAPVSRGTAGAESGTLAMLVGGEATDLAEAHALLEILASEIVHVGPVGAGQIAKLCNNMLAAIHTVALGEVLTAGVKAGIELERLTDAIRSAAGTSFILEQYLPRCLFGEERPTTFALSLMRKDLGLFMETAAGAAGQRAAAAVPLSAFVEQLYAVASASGRDDADFTSVAELYERLSGVELRLPAAAGVAA